MKTVKNIIIASMMFIILLTACDGKKESNFQNKQQGEKLAGSISLSGAFALYPLANIWAEEFRKLHPDVIFNISAGGAGKGMADVLAGAVDLGMFSRDIKEEEKQKGAYGITVSKDAVLPTISASNPVLAELQSKGLSQEEFHKIFVINEIKSWGEVTDGKSKEKINVYTRSDASGAADVWAKYVGAQGQEGIKGLGVFGDPGLAEAIKRDKNGIGYNNVIYVYDLGSKQKYPGIEVIPIDINNNNIIDEDEKLYTDITTITKAIEGGKYPSPPSRELYFITKGQPSNLLVKEFLKWVLTDGQKYVEEAGYIKLSAQKIEEEIQKVKY